MTHLLRLEPKWIVVMDDSDTEIMIDREHFQDWLSDQLCQDWKEFEDMCSYWYITQHINDTSFKQDMRNYLSTFHTLNTIEGLKIPLT